MTATSALAVPALAVGARVRFGEPYGGARRWWAVRAGDERFTILTRQADFKPKGTLFYTIIDRERGVRGPCNLIGQGWDDVGTSEGCESLLRSLQWAEKVKEIVSREGSYEEGDDDPIPVEVSCRNNVPIDILEVR
jgi:hypothetical protein